MREIGTGRKGHFRESTRNAVTYVTDQLETRRIPSVFTVSPTRFNFGNRTNKKRPEGPLKLCNF